MAPKNVNIRGQIVPLYAASHPREFSAYQGGDYFEFRHDGATDRWLMFQSAEDRRHDPGHVVACATSIQDAATDFTITSLRRVDGAASTPGSTSDCDLSAASIDTLVLVLGEALRLGYHDEHHHHPRRTASQIGDALGLARWNDLQQLQLGHAYMAGRQHRAIERMQRADR